jgi:hypothetical protein
MENVTLVLILPVMGAKRWLHKKEKMGGWGLVVVTLNNTSAVYLREGSHGNQGKEK